MLLLAVEPGTFWRYMSAAVSMVYIITVAAIIVTVIHQKRDPTKTSL